MTKEVEALNKLSTSLSEVGTHMEDDGNPRVKGPTHGEGGGRKRKRDEGRRKKGSDDAPRRGKLVRRRKSQSQTKILKMTRR